MSLEIKSKTKIYELSRIGKHLVVGFHKMLIGEIPLPLQSKLNISRDASPSDKNVILSKFQKLLG